MILQKEQINEPQTGKYIHVKEERLTEWPVEFLTRLRRTENFYLLTRQVIDLTFQEVL